MSEIQDTINDAMEVSRAISAPLTTIDDAELEDELSTMMDDLACEMPDEIKKVTIKAVVEKVQQTPLESDEDAELAQLALA
jgi:hypothetical protein